MLDRFLNASLSILQQGQQHAGIPDIVHEPLDFGQAKSEFFQEMNAVHHLNLVSGVHPVTGGSIDLLRLKQTDFVVMSQHTDRHPGQLRELADLEHGISFLLSSIRIVS
ncbi:hypothetical protein D3C73_1282930 [compost metagenome]